MAPPDSIQVLLTCARAGTAAGVSRPVSHNEEERGFEVFIHAAFVYVLPVSGVSRSKAAVRRFGVEHSTGHNRTESQSNVFVFYFKKIKK